MRSLEPQIQWRFALLPTKIEGRWIWLKSYWVEVEGYETTEPYEAGPGSNGLPAVGFRQVEYWSVKKRCLQRPELPL
jgi:hypothetical protein